MKGYIQTAVADLRKEPEYLTQDFSHHPLRDSQLLYGEKVIVLEQWKEWLRVEALEQPRFSEEKNWHSYPGWVHESEVAQLNDSFEPNGVICFLFAPVTGLSFPLSFGTLVFQEKAGILRLPSGKTAYCDPCMIRSLPFPVSREKLLKDARKFLATPYLWGGRAGFLPGMTASVDCSGLINLIHRSQGITIPRDAHDQYLKATPITEETLQPGDLIFLKKEDATRISHVILYTGSLTFLEAPETGKCVRLLSLLSPLGPSLKLEDRINRYAAYYGTFLT